MNIDFYDVFILSRICLMHKSTIMLNYNFVHKSYLFTMKINN